MKKQIGFTLIELAIALVIIGLLLGGVLKGQELINSAKVKNMVSDFKNLQVFIYGYQDKYKALPGDDAASTTHTGCTAGANGSCADGNGNSLIEGNWDSTNTSDESVRFWQHIRLAGLAPGATDPSNATFLPRNADGGRIGIQSASVTGATPTGLSGAYIACSAGVLGRYAKQIDTVLDDGTTNTGSVRAYSTVAGGWLTNTGLDDSTPYNICMAF